MRLGIHAVFIQHKALLIVGVLAVTFVHSRTNDISLVGILLSRNYPAY